MHKAFTINPLHDQKATKMFVSDTSVVRLQIIYTLPVLSQSSVVEKCPEQIQAQAAVAHVDIAPRSSAGIIGRRKTDSIPKTDTESYRALIADPARSP
jgi:hypothetical protein